MDPVFTSLKKLGVPKNYHPINTTDSFLKDVKFYQRTDNTLKTLKDIQISTTWGHMDCVFYDKIIPYKIKKGGKTSLLKNVLYPFIIEKYRIYCNDYETIDGRYLVRAVYIFNANHPQVDMRTGEYCIDPNYYEVPLTYKVWRGIREDLRGWNLDSCYLTPTTDYYEVV